MRQRAAALVFVGALTISSISAAAPARATPPMHGAVDARGLLQLEGPYGGALTADLWWGRGWLRGGAAAGVGALSAAGKQSSRVVTPVGLSLSLASPDDTRSGPTIALRAGVAPGAEKGGFAMGFWGSCAPGFRFALGEGASLRLGGEVWLLTGLSGTVFLGPFLGLGF